MFCVFFAGFLKIIVPGVGFQLDFSAPRVGVSHFLCTRGWSIRPFKNFPWGLPGGGWSGLGLIDTLHSKLYTLGVQAILWKYRPFPR